MRQITNHMTAYASILIGVLFLGGKGLIIGIEGSEPSIISIPQSTIAGWSFVSLAFVMFIPTIWIKFVFRFMRRIIGLKKVDKLNQFRDKSS